ncbi:PREDICTED: uncharacterized protein LOC109585293 [Amphimedon queenslandica]|uniref:Uncharacterized protein n=1 Tax=Amphimedon queenslandica TaxID=400682 RepID=A0AAN0JJD1_AMPQE|nr:PREDICTED: uncharacterized protein LOC109585293 [Amphimedon queenslandica]|eukprot:XP_019856862.1 PREDICTED: uncharacterized protein LOC109585293 [Amphimedon queenslandica]
MIPAENARSNDNHILISFNNDSIEHDKDYSLSVAAVNIVGVSSASEERRIVTSTLQSISASLHGYELKIKCHFANGSTSAGCFVIVVLTNGTELKNATATRSQPGSLTSSTTITLTKDTLSLPFVVVGRNYNITSGDPGLVEISATPILISDPPTEPIASTTASMVMESSYELNSQTPVPTFVSTGSSSTDDVVFYVAISGSAMVLGILILLIPLLMSLVVLMRHCKERKNGSETTIQPIEPSNEVIGESPKQESNGDAYRDTMNSRSTIRSEHVEGATGSSPVTVLDVDHIRLLMEREGGETQGLVQPYGVTNLIHKGLEVPVYQDVQDTDYHKHVALPALPHSDLPPNRYDQSSEAPPLVPPRNQSNRSLPKQRIYHVLESPGSSQGSTECVETPPPLYDEVSAVVQDMQNMSPKTATPTNSPIQTPPLPSRLSCHTGWKRNGATVANGYQEPGRVSSSPCFSPSPQLPLHLFSSSSPSPLLTNGVVIDSSDALTPPLPVLRAEDDDDDVFSSSASNTIETTPSPIAGNRHQTYQKLYRRHSQSQLKAMRAVTPHSYAVPSRSGSMPRGYQRPPPRGNYQRQNSCQANIRSHRVHPAVGDSEGVGQDAVHIKKSSSIPSAIMASTSRNRSSSVPGEEDVYNALHYRGYTQGNWTLKRTLV